MTIYKEVSRGQWRKIFSEHLHAKFLAIDWERMRLQLIVAAIYAGDKRCHPAPNKDYTFEAHGSPLGDEEVRLTKQNLGWPLEPAFYIPQAALAHFREALEQQQIAIATVLLQRG